jgi:hypothetical protein
LKERAAQKGKGKGWIINGLKGKIKENTDISKESTIFATI